LPTDLPDGLALCAVLSRADVRDVLIYRDDSPRGDQPQSQKRGLPAGATVPSFPQGATIATSSTRRQAQLLAVRPDLRVVPIRGNVGTRLQKLADRADLDGLVLAAAGLTRLRFRIAPDGRLGADPTAPQDKVPAGLRATFLSVEQMIPCVGQGAIGLEGRKNDARLAPIFARLNDATTLCCVIAERSFLHAMGGGCLSPVAAYAEVVGQQLRIRGVSFREPTVRRGERAGTIGEAAELGRSLAADLS
jgi:hydroxymethylbilane synthase